MPFNVQRKTFNTIRNDDKIVLCFSQDFLAFGPFFGFFWPSPGQKIPKTALRPKNLAAAQNFFLSFLMLILSCISTLKYTMCAGGLWQENIGVARCSNDGITKTMTSLSPLKDHEKNDLRSDQDHPLKCDLRSDHDLIWDIQTDI